MLCLLILFAELCLLIPIFANLPYRPFLLIPLPQTSPFLSVSSRPKSYQNHLCSPFPRKIEDIIEDILRINWWWKCGTVLSKVGKTVHWFCVRVWEMWKHSYLGQHWSLNLKFKADELWKILNLDHFVSIFVSLLDQKYEKIFN